MLGVAGLLRMLDIVADHPLDPPFATLGMNQVVAEFEREIIQTERRIGLSLEEMVEDNAFDVEVEVSDDPFSEMADDY